MDKEIEKKNLSKDDSKNLLEDDSKNFTSFDVVNYNININDKIHNDKIHNDKIEISNLNNIQLSITSKNEDENCLYITISPVFTFDISDNYRDSNLVGTNILLLEGY